MIKYTNDIFNIELIIIIMLKKFASAVTHNLVRAGVSTRFTPAFGFASDIEAVSKLRSVVEEEINYEESNMEDLSEFKNFFENQGWKINERGIQVELEKEEGPYQLRMLFNAKTPMSAEDNPDA